MNSIDKLIEKWRYEVTTYPHSVEGEAARAAVKLCAAELEKAYHDKKPNKYVDFIPGVPNERTLVWHVVSKSKEPLGIIYWFFIWKQYCFFPNADILLARGCIEEINNFLTEHKDDRV